MNLRFELISRMFFKSRRSEAYNSEGKLKLEKKTSLRKRRKNDERGENMDGEIWEGVIERDRKKG